MSKFTVKIVFTSVVEAASKEAILAPLEEWAKPMKSPPELIVTRYKESKKKSVDTRTLPLYNEESEGSKS